MEVHSNNRFSFNPSFYFFGGGMFVVNLLLMFMLILRNIYFTIYCL